MPPLLNIRQAAEYLGISRHTLYKLVERREVPAAKVGGSWRLNRQALDAFVAARSATATPIALVVEADETERHRLVDGLRGRAETVLASGSWALALALAEEHQPDVMFLSVPMPDRAAGDMMNDLRDTGVRPRVALMVAVADFPEAAAALEHGPAIILRKPVLHSDVVSILTLIAEWLGRLASGLNRGAAMLHPREKLKSGTGGGGYGPLRRPGRTLSAELSIIEGHLRALEANVARLESGLAALRAGAASVEEPRSPDRLETGELVIEHDARRASVNGVKVSLSPTEYRCLYALAQDGGRVVEHRDLLRRATGTQFGEPAHLKVYVARLRAKLKTAGASDRLVESVRGVGYRLATQGDSVGCPQGETAISDGEPRAGPESRGRGARPDRRRLLEALRAGRLPRAV